MSREEIERELDALQDAVSSAYLSDTNPAYVVRAFRKTLLALLEQEPVAWAVQVRVVVGGWSTHSLHRLRTYAEVAGETWLEAYPDYETRVTPLVPALTRERRDDE